MNQANETGLKTQTPKHSINEIPLQAIEGFSKVQLKEESLLGPSLKGEGVDNLLGNNYVGEDMPILNKGSLGLVNIIGEMRLQSIS